jgi:uncharacterized RDD family membrane protein YckC
MTQPPEDRFPPPGDPDPSPDAAQPPLSESVSGDEAAGAENAPTVAWSPPETLTAAGPMPAGAPGPSADAPMTPDPLGTEPAPPPPPQSPIISADAPPPNAGWQLPGAPAPLPPQVGGGWQAPGSPPGPPSGGGWQVPYPGDPVAVGQPGFVIASMGARFVAWLIDGLLAAIVPGILFFYVFDWQSFFRQMFDQMQFDANGNLIPNYGATYTLPITTDLILVTLIGLGVQFLYFVGFWTSRWQATPGQMGLKIRVVDAGTGGTLTVMQASKRFIALGYPLSLLVVVPVLQSAASLAEFGLTVFLFFSTVTNDRRQGLHDKFAGSLVIRSVTSGSGATIVGCLVYGVLVILIAIVASLAFVSELSPFFVELMDRFPRSAI